jgi:hypothetical protein
MLPDISDLQKKQIFKNKNEYKLFETILNICGTKIKETNEKTNHTFLIYEIPLMIIGHPYYNANNCIKFLINELQKANYSVKYISPKWLYIDWGVSLKKEPENKKIPDWVDNKYKNKLESQTKKLLKKYPSTKKVEFIFTENKK